MTAAISADREVVSVKLKKRWMKKTCIRVNIVREISKTNEMDEACDTYGHRRGA
jgi:hypothetical protein